MWPLYTIPPVAAFTGTVVYASCSGRSNLWGHVLSKGPTTARRAALTFDDGPTPGGTDRILDLLSALSIHATFFAIGRNVAAHPDLLRRVDTASHSIGNHSYDHPHHGYLRGRRYWFDQITRTNDAIAQATGRRPTLFRPPMGVRTPRMMSVARRLNMSVVTWTRRGLDGLTTTPAQILARFARVTPGDVLVLHDGVEPDRTRDIAVTLAALPDLIRRATDAGIEWVRLDQLFQPLDPTSH